MVKNFTLCVVLVLSVIEAVASAADSSVRIASSKNIYEFVYNRKTARVEVKEAINTTYSSDAYQVNLPVVESYNNDVSIEDVNAKVDNRTPHDFKPLYGYYSSHDIFYSDERLCYFNLLLPKKGSVANVGFNETVDDPRYFTSIFFSEEMAVDSKEVTVIVPRWMKLELKEMNFGNYGISKTTGYDAKKDADIITYSVKNPPKVYREENSPGPTYIYPHLLVLCKSASVDGHDFKYFGSLDDQYSWYEGLVKGIGDDKTIVAAKATELTAGLNTDMDKIKAVFYYVQDNIRYIAFEDGMAGFRPEKADEVLRKKYGDCKGMANLTKQLLVALGYDARLCWLGTDHIAYDYKTPSLAVDNHMICGLIYKGKTIYLDATESYLGINEYAERIQGRQVLMQDGDKYVLNHIPVADLSQNYDHEICKLSINGTSLTGSINHLWKGEDKEDVLSGLNSVKKENADEAMIKYLSNDNNDYVVKDLSVSSTSNPDKDLTASYNVDIKNGVSTFSKDYYVDMDTRKEFINSAIKIDERKNDYWFDHKVNLCKESAIDLPANYKVSGLPANLNIVNPDYEFHIQYASLPGKVTYKKNILIKNTHFSKTQFTQWNKDIEQLAKAYNETVILKPSSE